MENYRVIQEKIMLQDCRALRELLTAVTPEDIEPLSMARIDAEVGDPKPFAGPEWVVARRVVHACADLDIVNALVFHPRAVAEGVAALRAGARIVTDTHMARMGIPMRRLQPLGATVECLLGDARVAQRARREGLTQTAAAMDLLMEDGGADIIVIGNAPTALVRLAEHLLAGARPPRLVVAMPVGFVNASESKEFFLACCPTVPSIVLRGRKGGSPLAASAVNALATLALA